MPQSLANRLAHATITWLVIAVVLWTGWGWDDGTGFLAEPARSALLLVWLGLCWYGAQANTRTSNACGKNEIRKHRQVFWFVLPVLIGWFVYLPYADRHQIATSNSAFCDGLEWQSSELRTGCASSPSALKGRSLVVLLRFKSIIG
jgi:hypothetical protein